MTDPFPRPGRFGAVDKDEGPSWPTGLPTGLPTIPTPPPYYSFGSEGPMNHHGPPTTLQTSLSSTDPHPYPEHVPSTAASSLTSDNGPAQTSAGSGDHGSNDSDEPTRGEMYAAAGIVPVVIFAIIAAVVFCCLRKRKRQRREQVAALARAQEMKTRNEAIVAAHYTSTQPSPPPSTHPQYAAPPVHPPPPASPTSPQPVILGPIGGDTNGAYFTGIDTSDVMSTHERTSLDRTGLGNPFADGDSLNEEPPPPYRPRSTAPSSRKASLRAPEATHSRTNLIAAHNQLTRSPFADPGEEGTRSDISAVSDLSYQQEPTVTRPTV